MKDRDAKRNMLAIAADYDKLAEQLLSQAGNKIMPITAAVRRPGRPTKYTAELGAAICRLVVTGHSQRQIAAMAGMPATSTIQRSIDGRMPTSSFGGSTRARNDWQRR